MSDRAELINADCLIAMDELAARGMQVDSVVTDPPYHLLTQSNSIRSKGPYRALTRGFMGQKWDGGDVAFRPETWAKVFKLLKPGGHLLSFSGTRTYHRMACAIEDAGFEIRDCIAWVYGSGFPKSHDVSKAIDRAAGHMRGVAGEPTRAGNSFGQEYERTDKGEPITDAARQWQGWGTALKPSLEPICLARKPLSEKTIAANVLKHGTGAINVDGCRAGDSGGTRGSNYPKTGLFGIGGAGDIESINAGRWPANLVHDGSEEVVRLFPESISEGGDGYQNSIFCGGQKRRVTGGHGLGDSGSAARFFYTAKADDSDRLGSKHPTVKPVSLMRWLVRLVTPPNGLILDPFAGTGTTGMAALMEGFRCILIEREEAYFADIKARIGHMSGQDAPLFSGIAEAAG